MKQKPAKLISKPLPVIKVKPENKSPVITVCFQKKAKEWIEIRYP